MSYIDILTIFFYMNFNFKRTILAFLILWTIKTWPPNDDNIETKIDLPEIKVSVPERKKVPASPVKASPRKKALEDAEKVVDKVANLLQPSDILPLPHSYKDLANIFRTVDDLISHGHNYNLKAIKAKALKALRKPLIDSHLKQIKTVYPKAYLFSWESKKDSRGQPLQDYELHLYPNFENNKDCKMTPIVRVEREKLFKHHLLTIVQDHHQEFLQTLGIDTLENR